LKRALIAIEKLREENERLRAVSHNDEAIAIVGMSCRYPGNVGSLDAMWRLLSNREDGIVDIPEWRWSAEDFYSAAGSEKGKLYVKRAGLLEDYRDFDAGFFNISPIEAESLDPQQRLALEVCWEAVENSQCGFSTLSNNTTGVFLGVTTNDYAQVLSQTQTLEEVTPYFATGNSHCVLAGRVAYVLDLKGPAVALDTACSSSLVAVHLAAQSLRNGECHYALAGGVNVVLSPLGTLSLCQARMLSPDGRCNTFDKTANGFARAEGAGAVLLKRLSDALKDGDQIMAIIRGSSINQDGDSSGLTVPNGLSQQSLIKAALSRAGVDPLDVSYIEAHGTGTELGDPIEIGALAQAYCQGRRAEAPLWVGSVKTNIGHCESAAGIAGLIKTVLALQHKSIPAHLNFKEPNPHIDWSRWPLQIPVEAQPWLPINGKRLAGVSAFGFSGTNAHVIVEEAPAREVETTHCSRVEHLLTFSAKSEEALRVLAERYADRLEDPSIDLGSLCHQAGIGRSDFHHRQALVGAEPREMARQLRSGDGVMLGDSKGRPARTAVLFTGQGSQYGGMGEALYRESSVFRSAVDECDRYLQPKLGISLPTLLWGDAQSLLQDTRYTQPALFALEYGLYQWWSCQGVEAHYLLGHSVGEYVAACVAGVFSLEDGLTLIEARGRLMVELALPGGMLAVLASGVEVEALLVSEQKLSIAAYNGPSNTVVAGCPKALLRLQSALDVKGWTYKTLDVSHGFHSPQMLPVLEMFRAVAQQIRYQRPHTAIVSNVTGRLETDRLATAEYWVEHILAPVKFAEGIGCLAMQGVEVYLEMGPQPILTAMARRVVSGGVWLASLQRERSVWSELLRGLATLYVRGQRIDWGSLNRDYRFRHETLPNYPFQRKRYWPSRPVWKTGAARGHYAGNAGNNKVLGQEIVIPGTDDIRFAVDYSRHSPGFLIDHQLYNILVVPGSAHISTMLCAVKRVFPAKSLALAHIQFFKPLVLHEEQTVQLQTVIRKEEGSSYSVQILSVPYSGGGVLLASKWVLHASAKVDMASVPEVFEIPNFRDAKEVFECGSEEYYRTLEGMCYNLGETFSRISRVKVYEGGAVGSLDNVTAELSEPYVIYPGLLDSCLQMLGFCVSDTDEINDKNHLKIPFSIDRLDVCQEISNCRALMCAVIERNPERRVGNMVNADLYFYDEQDRPLLTLRNASLRRVSRSALERDVMEERSSNSFLVTWQQQEAVASTAELRLKRCYMLWMGGEEQRSSHEACVKELRLNCDIVKEIDLSREEFSNDMLWEDEGDIDGILIAIPSQQHLALDSLEKIVKILQFILPRRIRVRNWFYLTQQSHRVLESDAMLSPATGLLTGFNRVLRNEYPEMASRILDWDGVSTITAEHWHALISHRNEDLVAVRNKQIWVSRLIADEQSTVDALQLDLEGTYVVTGGFGGIGRSLVEWMLNQGVKNIAVLDRGRSTAHTLDAGYFNNQGGANIHRLIADIGDMDSVVDALDRIRQSMPPIVGVFHLAGQVDDDLFSDLSWQSFSNVLSAKVTGTWNLHQATLADKLSMFVCFSSASVLLGTVGQANYTAANGYMDHFALWRRTQGLPALSIQWGPWTGEGMAARTPEALNKYLVQFGVEPKSAEYYLEHLSRLLVLGRGQACVVSIDWEKYLSNFTSAYLPAVFSRLVTHDSVEKVPGLLLQQLKSAADDQRYTMLSTQIEGMIISILHLPSETKLSSRVGFFELGMDSLMVLELKKSIEYEYKIAMAPSIVFNYPTLGEFTYYLATEELGIAPLQEYGSEQFVEDVDLDKLSVVELAGMLEMELGQGRS